MTREERRHALLVAALSNPALCAPMLQFRDVEALCKFTGTMRTGLDGKDMMRANTRLAVLQIEAVVNELLGPSGETS